MKSDLAKSVALYSLEMLPVDDLPQIAIEALEAGYDSVSLRELAGGQSEHPFDFRQKFEKALKELQLPMPCRRGAAILLACHIAKSILKGEMSPYEGARRIWWDLYTKVPEAIELQTFVGAASEIEDDPEHRDYYISDITKECNNLLLDHAPWLL